MRTIKMMADYECFPLWEASPGQVGNIDPATLPISKHLQDDLLSWAAAYDLTLNREDPLSSGFSTPQQEEAFRKTAQELAYRLKTELGSDHSVTWRVI